MYMSRRLEAKRKLALQQKQEQEHQGGDRSGRQRSSIDSLAKEKQREREHQQKSASPPTPAGASAQALDRFMQAENPKTRGRISSMSSTQSGPQNGEHIMKEGNLMKRRDLLNTWPMRFCSLQDCTLYYYKSEKDRSSKGTINIAGATVHTVFEEANPKFWPFTVRHPVSTREYHFAASSREIAEDWVRTIDQASRISKPNLRTSRNPRLSADSASSAHSTLSDERPQGGDNKANGRGSPVPVAMAFAMSQNPRTPKAKDFLLSNLSPELQKELATAEKEFDSLCADLKQWSLVGEEGSIVAYHQTSGGVLVMGKGQIYYSPRCLWQAILDPYYRMKYDDVTASTKVVEHIDNQTFLLYTVYKPFDSAPPRDFFSMVHWRVQQDGTILILEINAPPTPEYAQVPSGYVRGRKVLEAWRLKPMDGYTTCDMTYVSKIDFGPNFTDRHIAMATESRPFLANRISELLDQAPSLDDSLFTPLTNQDQLPLTKPNQNAPIASSKAPEQEKEKAANNEESHDANHVTEEKALQGVQDTEAASETGTYDSSAGADLSVKDYAGVLARADAHFSTVFNGSTRWKLLQLPTGLDCRIRFTEDLVSVATATTVNFKSKHVLKAVVSRRTEVDRDLIEHEVVRRLNSSTTIEYFRYEPIEGALPREFTSIVQWRVGANDEIYVIETDVSWIPEKPQLFDCVRGRRLVQAWKLVPKEDGARTEIFFAHTTDYGPGYGGELSEEAALRLAENVQAVNAVLANDPPEEEDADGVTYV